MTSRILWRGTPPEGAGWSNLDRSWSTNGFFFAEDPGVAKRYVCREGRLVAYTLLPCKTLSLLDPVHALIVKNSKITSFLDDWIEGYRFACHTNQIYQSLADGTLYTDQGPQCWVNLIRSVEFAGYDHLVIRDLSEESLSFGPERQEEPIIHVVFDKKYLQELYALPNAA